MSNLGCKTTNTNNNQMEPVMWTLLVMAKFVSIKQSNNEKNGGTLQPFYSRALRMRYLCREINVLSCYQCLIWVAKQQIGIVIKCNQFHGLLVMAKFVSIKQSNNEKSVNN
jgi:hypothetical protein